MCGGGGGGGGWIKVLKWQTGPVLRPGREAESVDELFVPVEL